jgi:exodeoxyribonuclease V beta subunit
VSQLRMPFEPPEPEPFEVYGELPAGVTLLEASAGTGKTFTIAALVTRYVAEGTPLERLLVVTFTRMATGELRDRVRQRLVLSAAGLSQVRAGVPPTDELVALLAQGAPEVVAERHRRLVVAIADFDAATIDTTHGFCLHVLMGLGVAGDVERDVRLVEDVSDLLEEVVDDLYVRRFWASEAAPNFNKKVAMAVARSVVDNSAARVVPELSDDASSAAMRRRLAVAVRTELDRRKREAGIVTYDDLLTRLRDALSDDVSGRAARSRLSTRYRVVLVDEFQDTDPIQWEILDRAFRGSTLVLIGDPKQAIYAFRGADVFAYLNAAKSAESRSTLGVNWRSDERLIRALDALFAGAQLGQEGIAYHQVEAAPENVGSCISGSPCDVGFRMRILDRDQVEKTNAGYAKSPVAQRRIAGDLADDVRALLASGAEIVECTNGEEFRSRVSPGDIAVLVRTNRHAGIVREALIACGVPAVVAGGGSVFDSEPAIQWMRLLSALERPTWRPGAAAAALTRFVGWSADDVARATESDWEALHWRLARWSAVLGNRGVAALLEQISAAGLPARVLSLPSGERFLTDLFHLGRLLHTAAVEENLGRSSLVAWLRRRLDESAGDRNDEEMSLRLESDAEAVQILTIHRSKGLEFPIVYCPYAWDGYLWKEEVPVPVFHDPESRSALTVDVGGKRVGFCDHTKLEHDEQKGEDLRLLYVALTRARHQVVMWWAGTQDGGKSPLSRLLFSRGPDGVVSPDGRKTPSDDEIRATFSELAERAAGCISIETVTEREVGFWAPDDGELPDLEVALFDRAFDATWRRTSYSGITAPAHATDHNPDPRVGSEHEESLVSDEKDMPLATEVPRDAGTPAVLDHGAGVPLLLSSMPGGVEVGSFVHAVLEETDFAAGDLDADLRRAIHAAAQKRSVDIGDPELLVGGLAAAINTPLGRIGGGRRLRDVARGDRLDELNFELPIAGGDTPAGRVSMSDIAATMRAHCVADDPVGSYCDRLLDPALAQEVCGFLTGSIDLVCRFGDRQFVVVDYKTNRLAPAGAEVFSGHYGPEALAAEMNRSHYPLQAVLYTVALHRYMRWRDPAWDPAENLAGVLYLFVRGMSSREFPTVDGEPCGVWSWRPPPDLVCELSDMFDKGGGRS